jgi:anthranilate/para-aminobenzoate synthase component I
MYNILPHKKKFLENLTAEKVPPITIEIPFYPPSQLFSLFCKENSILLESVKGPQKIARYSFIGFNPCLIFKLKNGSIEINNSKRLILGSENPLTFMKLITSNYKQINNPLLPPFQGGLAGVFSYDFVRYLERIPEESKDDLNIPDAYFMLLDKLIVFDHSKGKSWIIVSPGVRKKIEYREKYFNSSEWSEMYDEAEYELVKIFNKIFDYKHYNFNTKKSNKKKIEINYEMKKIEYTDMVMKAKEYIAAGDIFQANLSQRVSALIEERNPYDLYLILRDINPSPFAAFANLSEYIIVSSSPERLLKINNNKIETRPIAGTRPRGRDKSEDDFMREELLLNEKERAEHIMLIDLERNDLGRVSEYGSIKVDELMITEDYSHVIHIVSNIKGLLKKDKDCYDAIRAAFPGGTITGVPKVRCMEIIEELEPVRRGPYTGSLGYISFSGNMDLNIIIRTFVIKDNIAYVQAGAGIVADSNPEREYFETLKKAEALIRTLEII